VSPRAQLVMITMFTSVVNCIPVYDCLTVDIIEECTTMMPTLSGLLMTFLIDEVCHSKFYELLRTLLFLELCNK